MRCVVRRFPAIIFVSAVLLFGALAVLGAGPYQAERPPQPFFQDFFSGTVLLEGSSPPEGTLLIACIDDCEDGFESLGYPLKADGSFTQLEVKPLNEELVGHTITFYLENEFGRIRALESRPYIGVFDFYVQDLTFVDPMPPRPTMPTMPPMPTPGPTPLPEPTPRPTPIALLPVAGDPSVAQLPKIALMAGGAAVVTGAGLLVVARRKII